MNKSNIMRVRACMHVFELHDNRVPMRTAYSPAIKLSFYYGILSIIWMRGKKSEEYKLKF